MRAFKLLPIAAFILGLSSPAGAETEETFKAFSVWESHGGFVVPGEAETIYSATLIGRLYVETEKGPVEAGMLSCPATVKVKTADRSQVGSAICAISTKDGGQVTAELKCSGVYLLGCSGDATITGGTGRFAGITGDGKFTIRSDLAQETGGAGRAGQMSGPGMPTMESMGGILFFESLHYKLP